MDRGKLIEKAECFIAVDGNNLLNDDGQVKSAEEIMADFALEVLAERNAEVSAMLENIVSNAELFHRQKRGTWDADQMTGILRYAKELKEKR